MLREQLEHIIRAAGDIAGVKQIIIMGSQAILGEHPELAEMSLADSSGINILLKRPAIRTLFQSQEADVMIKKDHRRAELVEGSIGEHSIFHDTYGYYAQAIDETTCKLPSGWQERLIKICNDRTNFITGLCLETHDLVISKLIANRVKDIEFYKATIDLGLVRKDELLKRLDTVRGLDDTFRERVGKTIEREFEHHGHAKTL